MTVKLAEVLKQGPPPSTTHFGVQLIDGTIGPDTSEGFFRVHPNAADKGRYFILRVEDVSGDLHKWTEDELSHAHLVGQERYRIPIRYGAVVHKVVVHTFIARQRRAPSRGDELCAPTSCQTDADCGSGCRGCFPDTDSGRCE